MKIKVGFDAIKFGQAALGEAPEGFDAIDVGATTGEGFLLVDAHMFVVADVDEAVVARPSVRTDDALGIDPPANDGPETPADPERLERGNSRLLSPGGHAFV